MTDINDEKLDWFKEAQRYNTYLHDYDKQKKNFGCEERPDDAPVMAIVTLVDSSGKEVTVKAEDARLYERNINEGDKVCLDVNNKLEKVE